MAGTVSNPHQANVPMDLSWYVRKGVAKRPADRYPSVNEMLDRLTRRAEGRIPIQCHITFMKRMNGEWSRMLDRHPILITFVLLAIVVAMVAGGVNAVVHRG